MTSMNRPNVLVVILDTVRAANLSLYGYARETTPFLESFASEADLFKNAFTPAIWTIPSHASIFTGTYPSKHGALNLHRHLDRTYPTLAEVLSTGGYDTICYSNNLFLSHERFGLSRGFTQVVDQGSQTNRAARLWIKARQRITGTRDSGASVTNMFARRAMKRSGRSGNPFFLVLNYMEAHAPYVRVPRRFLNNSLTMDQRKAFGTIDQDRQRFLTGSGSISNAEFDVLRSVYDCQISYLDHVLQRLVNWMKRADVFDNTLIIITSDHGDLIGEHGLVHHSYALYEELVRVPLIVKRPGQFKSGAIHDGLVSLVDIYPTILESVHAGNEHEMAHVQGENLFTSSSGRDGCVFMECERPRNEFAESYPDFDFSVFDREMRAVRTRSHKFIWSSDGDHALYDLVQDPAESVNRYRDEGGLASDLEGRLTRWYESFEKKLPAGDQEDVDLDDEMKTHLQALGYF